MGDLDYGMINRSALASHSYLPSLHQQHLTHLHPYQSPYRKLSYYFPGSFAQHNSLAAPPQLINPLERQHYYDRKYSIYVYLSKIFAQIFAVLTQGLICGFSSILLTVYLSISRGGPHQAYLKTQIVLTHSSRLYRLRRAPTSSASWLAANDIDRKKEDF